MKSLKWIAVAALLCLLLVACDSGSSTPAPTADARSADQRTAMRQGLEHSKEVDRQKLPGRLEMGLAIGSIIAMIGVLKYV